MIAPRRAKGPAVAEACDFSIKKFHCAKETGLTRTVGRLVTGNDPGSTWASPMPQQLLLPLPPPAATVAVTG